MDDIYERLRKRDAAGPSPQPEPYQPAPPPRTPASASSRVEAPLRQQDATERQYQPKPKRRRWPIVLTVLILLIGAGSAGAAVYIKNRNIRSRLETTGPKAPAEPLQGRTQQNDASIRLVATGDMIGHESINKNARQEGGGYDYVRLMSDMKPYFEKADIRFCNQATPAGGEQFGISGYPVFNAPIEFARGIEGVGCNVINLGTNHTNDKGQALIDATVAAWDDRQNVLAVAGANRSPEEQKKQRIFTVKGMKFALLSYTTYTNKPLGNSYGVDMYNEAAAKTDIAAAQENADFVLISMRWGTEYSADINAQQDQIAQVLADAGADAIVGHGPHALQPVKLVKATDGREVPVWFSLGNFLNSQLEIENLIGGFAVMDIDTSSKKITKISFMPVYQHYEWTAEQSARHNQADLLARHSFTMVPLDKAANLIAKSHHNTTVEVQAERIKALLNKFTEVPIITSTEY
jgi:poly-gamma-glutamate capsule biosynthesis protein CapA/YwtB (metallophosphatase superfamily)